MTRPDLPTCCSLIRVLAFVIVAASPGAPAEAQERPGVSFVFGSDTSTPGINVRDRTALYPAGGFALFSSPSGNAARSMDDAFRRAHTDSYGDPLRLTWWMQNGSLYRAAENTNVPLPSTLSTYLMRTYHGEAVERLGDELTFHYHTWVWNDDDGDGRYYWNQARAFTDEVREDFERTMAEGLLDEGMYPASFRSGWHYMDDAWQAHLDRRIPFTLHNDAPYAHDDRVEPIDNLFDWSRAPLEFVPFRPSAEDYQRPGGSGGWNVRSVALDGVSEALVRQAFQGARDGTPQVACFWGHLAESGFMDQLGTALSVVERVAAEFPDVPFRYETAAEAMRRWQGRGDETAPTLTLEAVGGGSAFRVTASEPLFQDVPFVALLDRHERRRVLAVEPIGPLTWETTDPVDPALVAKVAAAATDSAGHVATVTHRVLPDDRYVDNLDAGYAETEGTWSTVGTGTVDQVWGTDLRAATLAEGETAAARWALPVEASARYHAFVRVPDVERPAGHVRLDLTVDGAVVASQTFVAPPPPDVWLFVGAADLASGQAATVEVRASGDGQPGTVLAADAVKLSALVRDRQLHVAAPELDLGDAVFGEASTVQVRLRNLGTGPLTVSSLSTSSGVLTPDGALPLVLGGMETRDVPLQLFSEVEGLVLDTLTVTSDDPVEPTRRVPVRVRFRDTFVVVDDDGDGYAEAGDWRTSSAQAYGESSRYAFVQGTDNPEAVFTAPLSRGGVYAVEFLLPAATNSAVRADYTVSVDGSERAVHRVDQNEGSGAWRSLGRVDVGAGATVEVRLRPSDRDQPGRVLRADAVRLLLLGDALVPSVLDDADPAHYRETGAWSASSAQAFGPTSRYAPFGGDSRAVFETTASESGAHAVSFIVPTTVNASQRALYRVRRNGFAVDSVMVDQNEGSGGWRLLGAWPFEVGDRVEVEVSNAETTASDRVLRADAVRVEAEGATDAVDGGGPGAVTLSAVRPNPASGVAHVTFTLAAPGPVHLEVLDVLGRRVAVLAAGPRTAGEHVVTADVSSLSSGAYVFRLRAGGTTATRVVTVVD